MEENKINPEMEEEAAAEENAEAAEPEAKADEACEGESEKLSKSDKKKLKQLAAELERLARELQKKEEAEKEANDKYMRLYAEYDNFRRRTALEKEGIYSDAYADALGQILPIMDNMERALQFIPEGEETPVSKGMELIAKSFAEALEKMGVSEIEALGKEFDPNLHNAVMHIDDESFGESEVVEVLMKGYIKGDKVLRYAMVKVAN